MLYLVSIPMIYEEAHIMGCSKRMWMKRCLVILEPQQMVIMY